MDKVGIRAVVEGFDQYVRQTATLEKSTDRFAASTQRAETANKRSGGTFGLNVGQIARAGLAVAGLTAGIGGVTAATVKGIQVGAEFERQLDRIASVSGASSSELGRLTEQARELGRSTIFSASEVAAAQLELVKAGVSVADVMGGALPGALSLAAAGELALADAARVAALAMTQFGLSGGDVEHIADVLVATADKGVSSVTSLSEALNNVGPIAAQLGIPLEDTVAFLGLLESAGIRGAEAGTSLRRILLSLIDPTAEAAQVMSDLGINAFDAEGKFIGLAKFTDNLRDAMSGLDDKSQALALSVLFDTFAITGATVAAREGAAGMEEMRFQTEDAGAAAEKAAEQTDNLAGDYEELKGAAEDLAIELEGRLDPALRGTFQTLTEFVDFLRLLMAGEWETLWQGFNAGPQNFAIAIAEAIDQAVAAVAHGFNLIADIWNKTIGKLPGVGDIDKLDPGSFDLSGMLERARNPAFGPSLEDLMRGPTQAQLDAMFIGPRLEDAGGGGRSYTPPKTGGAGRAAKEEISALQAFIEDISSAGLLDQFIQQFGEAGGEAVAALVTAIQTGAESDGRRLADSVDALIDAARERGVPNADELGTQLIATVATALETGTPEAIAAAEAAIQAMASAIGHNAITSFDAAISDALAENALIAELGEQGASVMQALEEGIRLGTPEAGQALSDAVDEVLDELDNANIPGAAEMGGRLVQAVADAIEAGTPEAVQAVFDLVDEINEALKKGAGQVELTVSSFFAGINQAIARENLRATAGDAGVQVVDGLVDALINGKPEAIGAVQDTVGGIIFELHDKLDAQTAASLGAALMAALTAALASGGTDAINAVAAVLTTIQGAFDAAAEAASAAAAITPIATGGGGGVTAEQEADARKRAIEEARRHRIDSVNRLGDAIMEALRRQYGEQEAALLESIRRQRDALSDWADEQFEIRAGPILAELEAMDQVEKDERRAELERKLALTYDAKERAEIQKQLDDLLRDERREELRDQLGEIETQVEEERRIKEEALDAEAQRIADHYAFLTSEAQLQAQARLLIEAENQDAIIALIQSYYPDWNATGKSLGEQLVDGIQSSGIADEINSLLELVSTTNEALSDLFYEAPTAGGGGGGGSGGGFFDNTPPKKPPTKAPPVGGGGDDGTTGGQYIGVPADAVNQGWNLVTTGALGPSLGSDYGSNEVYLPNPDGTMRRVGPDEAIPPSTAVWLFKYLQGTLFHPGGPALVHKDEILNLPRGAQVYPPDFTKMLHDAMLPALAARGGDTVTLSLNFDGANFAGTPRDNAEAIRHILRTELATMSRRESRHWGVNR